MDGSPRCQGQETPENASRYLQPRHHTGASLAISPYGGPSRSIPQSTPGTIGAGSQRYEDRTGSHQMSSMYDTAETPRTSPPIARFEIQDSDELTTDLSNDSWYPIHRVAAVNQNPWPHRIAHGANSSTNQPHENGASLVSQTHLGNNNQSATKTLDKEFQRQHRSYFKFGRVFSTLWHDNARHFNGNSISFSMTNFGVPVFSKIIRPIHTYSGRGAAKPGINLASHAPIVQVGDKPEDHRPEMMNEILEVSLNSPQEKLHPKSLVNFDKVRSVEDYYRVKPLGQITPESGEKLRQMYNRWLSLT
ncbi:hypothetical protein VTO42DRAFT_1429 [Malbranchea cinnamomea]